MAENLIWQSKVAYPGRKLIVWAASRHIVRHPEVIRFSDGESYHKGDVPMGDHLWRAWGDRVYSLGFLAAEGECLDRRTGQPQPVPAPPPGSLEALLLLAGVENAIVPFRDRGEAGAWLEKQRVARPFQYGSTNADWTRVFDGMVFTRRMTPATIAAEED